MAAAIQLETDTIAALDAMVTSGRFPSRDVAIRSALFLVQENDSAVEPLDDETIAAIERGLADVKAGRTRPADDVFRELRAEFGIER